MPDRDQDDAPAKPRTNRSWRRRALRYATALIAVVIVLSLAGALYESRSEAAEARAYPPPGLLVDMDGYRLHIVCAGAGNPVVVVDAGLGDWSTAWSLVQPQVAKTTKICTYDRAGSGWSDPGPPPRIAGEFSRELHTLLARAGVPGPYVLVGHSMGGLTMQLFAHDYPAEVAGLVLVDSMNPGPPTRPASEVRTPTNLPFGIGFLARAMGHLGIARILAGPLGSAPHELSSEAAGASVARGVRPLHLQAFLDESFGLSKGIAQASEVRSLGVLPLTVLSRATKNSDAEWQARQADLLRLSSRSQHVVSESSGHAVHLERPDEAIAAIVDMVVKVR